MPTWSVIIPTYRARSCFPGRHIPILARTGPRPWARSDCSPQSGGTDTTWLSTCMASSGRRCSPWSAARLSASDSTDPAVRPRRREPGVPRGGRPTWMDRGPRGVLDRVYPPDPHPHPRCPCGGPVSLARADAWARRPPSGFRDPPAAPGDADDRGIAAVPRTGWKAPRGLGARDHLGNEALARCRLCTGRPAPPRIRPRGCHCGDDPGSTPQPGNHRGLPRRP